MLYSQSRASLDSKARKAYIVIKFRSRSDGRIYETTTRIVLSVVGEEFPGIDSV